MVGFVSKSFSYGDPLLVQEGHDFSDSWGRPFIMDIVRCRVLNGTCIEYDQRRMDDRSGVHEGSRIEHLLRDGPMGKRF